MDDPPFDNFSFDGDPSMSILNFTDFSDYDIARPWKDTLSILFLDSLFLLSDLTIFLTFFTMVLLLYRKRTAAGVSLQTLIVIVSGRVLHLYSYAMEVHYRPEVLPSFLFAAMDVGNACTGVGLIGVFVKKYMGTYQKDKDTFGVSSFVKMLPRSPLTDTPLVYTVILYTIACVIALVWQVIRTRLHAFGTYYFCLLEVLAAVSLLPQLFMFHKDKVVSPLLGKFVLCCAATRFFMLIFWCLLPYFHRINARNRWIQISTETFNVMILSDFLYYWVRSTVKGEEEIRLGALV